MTPGLREARLIEFIGPDPAQNFHFVQAMMEAGLVVREVDQPSGQADALVLASGFSGDTLTAHSRAVAQLSRAAPRLEQSQGALVLLQDTGGSFQPRDARAWLGGLAGLGRTAQKEFPSITVRTIDVDLAALGARPAADRVVEELLSGGAAPCVGLSETGRVVPAEVDAHNAPSSPDTISAQDTFLVTGGARGVTATCIIELSRRTRANFVLLGRSHIEDWPAGLASDLDERALRGALAARAKAGGQKMSPAELNRQASRLLAGAEIRQTLSALEAAGSRVHYAVADVADASAVKAAIRDAESLFGPITGLVHGAGVLADKLIREKTAEQIARVFSPKVLGLQTILSTLDARRLKHIAFFSSVAARYGNTGQSDYAMANEILNRVAHGMKAANPGACVTSLGWGPWDGGMVDDSLRAKFAEMGVSLIPQQDGANLFADALLAGPLCPVELIIGSELGHG
ncbi:SDR family NAD(P)-dependent oxidoreductase [Henriciella pelagia]|uniref:Ketoreductase domain-containing protein n=3 Tax=Henriciella pelagia TaxID=1977912 RepID=A0ABQ1JZQ3_9PROT|nr:SDR family NAD(P)-dependent oxidoreductase [Henriciella pelagia]GGB79702.1 hypothetical protein GCM10011503_30560 [Henriciella pelagia]